MKKTLTMNAVLNATLLLIDAHPRNETTTLEVKTLLRHLGYHATQDDVSELVEVVADNCDLVYETVSENGATFRVYSQRPLIEDEPEPEDVADYFAFRL